MLLCSLFCNVHTRNDDLFLKIMHRGIEQSLARTARVDWQKLGNPINEAPRLPLPANFSQKGRSLTRFNLSERRMRDEFFRHHYSAAIPMRMRAISSSARLYSTGMILRNFGR